MTDAHLHGRGQKLVAHGAALAAAGEMPVLLIGHSRLVARPPSSDYQNASAGSSIVLAAPAWMRARWVAVSGSMRSMKKRPVTSLACMRVASPSPPASLACAASTIRYHM